jgi:hypothetical protein
MRILAHGEKAVQKGNTIKQDDLFKQIDETLIKRKTHK